ncbi:TetR family transcriptional regulator [Ciceribacter lividus]|uniref:TetR family transcriptional regulator n=1 Tax=Ciceribacter lividus TaxID=1197950 RepID=A0A6I7HK66_9HYPH|nr:TetR/AcrR family transcriptional regulator [Ciceribacter lividus]RCW22059.1 TetR family transcriptional regulator [Ciceribacter lividus]
MSETPSPTPDNSLCSVGRFAAGEDPVKREQILDGARSVFMRMGFDAASMNDVTREAGVSKGTIYVYFDSKEELFGALIEREKGRFTEFLRDILADSDDVRDGLRRFGIAFARHIIKSDMIPAMRILLGVVDRMPGLCKRFFASAPANARTVLRAYIEQQVEAGALKVDDTDLAARQYIELATGQFFRQRLFGEMTVPPEETEIEYVVDSGLKVFMAAYGPEARVDG